MENPVMLVMVSVIQLVMILLVVVGFIFKADPRLHSVYIFVSFLIVEAVLSSFFPHIIALGITMLFFCLTDMFFVYRCVRGAISRFSSTR